MDFCISELENLDFNKYLDLLSQLNNHREKIDQETFNKKHGNIKSKGGFIIVVKFKNELIGSGKILIEEKFYNPVGHIEDIVVDKEFRNKGIGSIILKELISIGKKYLCYKIILSAKEELDKFYTNNGFLKSENEYRMIFQENAKFLK